MKKNKILLALTLVISMIFPMFQVSGANIPGEVVGEYEVQTTTEEDPTLNTHAGVSMEDVLLGTNVQKRNVRPGDFAKIEFQYDTKKIENIERLSLTLVNEHNEDFGLEYAFIDEHNQITYYFPVRNNAKPGKYWIRDASYDGTLKTGEETFYNYDEGDQALSNAYFYVEINEQVSAEFSISETQIGPGESAILELQFNTEENLGEYVRAVFLTERGNNKNYTLKKISDVLYRTELKYDEAHEVGKYSLDGIYVFNGSEYSMDNINVLNQEIELLGEVGSLDVPIIREVTLEKNEWTRGETVQFDLYIESGADLEGFYVQGDDFNLIRKWGELVKISDTYYQGTLTDIHVNTYENYDHTISDFMDVKLDFRVYDIHNNVSEVFSDDSLQVKVHAGEERRTPIIKSITSDDTVYAGETASFTVQVQNYGLDIHELSIGFLNVEYGHGYTVVYNTSNLRIIDQNEDVVTISGKIPFDIRGKGSVWTPDTIHVLLENGLHVTAHRSHSYLNTWGASMLTDMRSGIIRVLPARVNETTRYSGLDRYRTAVEISKMSNKKAEYAVLVSGQNFPDALAAGPMAYVYDAPILLTKMASLPQSTKGELLRLGVTNVILLGGESVITNDVVDELTELGIIVDRLSGSSRFQTAALSAAKIFEKSSQKEKVVLTNSDTFADSLSIGSYASKENLPILLTKKDKLSNTTKTALTDLLIKEVIIMGGEAAVSIEVEDELKAMEIEVTRIAGSSRFHTAIKTAEDLFPTSKDAIVTSGENYADALAAAPYAAKLNAPILLVRKDRIHTDLGEYVKNSNIRYIYTIGGPAAVSDNIIQWLRNVRVQ